MTPERDGDLGANHASTKRSRERARTSTWDAKTIAAVAALIAAISGGVELRVQVGLLVSKVDRIEAEQRAVREQLQHVARND